MTTLETDYVHALMERAQVELRGVCLFRRNTGAFRLQHTNATGEETSRFFRAALPGQCDLYALARGGRHYEIECKKFSDLSDAQKVWRAWCLQWEIPWLLLNVHKRELPVHTIERWIVELKEFFQ